jgi:hypothetical protein
LLGLHVALSGHLVPNGCLKGVSRLTVRQQAILFWRVPQARHCPNYSLSKVCTTGCKITRFFKPHLHAVGQIMSD